MKKTKIKYKTKKTKLRELAQNFKKNSQIKEKFQEDLKGGKKNDI